jgi:hypothetical protein
MYTSFIISADFHCSNLFYCIYWKNLNKRLIKVEIFVNYQYNVSHLWIIFEIYMNYLKIDTSFNKKYCRKCFQIQNSNSIKANIVVWMYRSIRELYFLKTVVKRLDCNEKIIMLCRSRNSTNKDCVMKTQNLTLGNHLHHMTITQNNLSVW